MAVWSLQRLTPAQFDGRPYAAAALFGTELSTQAALGRQLGVTPAGVAVPAHGAAVTAARATARVRRDRDGLRRRALDAAALRGRGARAFGVRYHPHALARSARAYGFTSHQPAPRALESDEYVIAHWRAREGAALMNQGHRQRHTLVLVDESGHTFPTRFAWLDRESRGEALTGIEHCDLR